MVYISKWTFLYPTATSGEAAGLEKGCYLASGSKDQTVKIWSTVKSKGESHGLNGQTLKISSDSQRAKKHSAHVLLRKMELDVLF